ncbi:MAG: hypothetical protein MUO67_25725 [Anaerolineales bacterium]|jgi:hypothetical protein|nr:hypothetical protein [Anaerolineales bacterium]
MTDQEIYKQDKNQNQIYKQQERMLDYLDTIQKNTNSIKKLFEVNSDLHLNSCWVVV